MTRNALSKVSWINVSRRLHWRTERKRCLVLVVLLATTIHTNAAAENTNALVHAAEQFREKMSAAHEGNANIMVSRGLVANRKSRNIDFVAASTGVAQNSPVEFLIISPTSGHDYEALAVAAVEPSTLHNALTFIGLGPGRSVDSSALAFWPKGERVRITIACRDTNFWQGTIAAETLVRDANSGNPMPSHGFVFVGSRWLTPQNSTNREYMADVMEPHAIVSLYNEPGTVLDQPGQAAQGAVYGTRLANPDYALPADTLLDIRIEPERLDGAPRVREMSLTIPAAPGAQPGLAGIRCSLTEGKKSVLMDKAFSDVLHCLSDLVKKEFDPFLELRFGGRITMEQARAVCEVLMSLEGKQGIRIEPPPQGQLYFKAFLPNEKHRTRADRHAQPWELRLYSSSSTNRTRLTHIEEIWKEDRIYPELKPTDFHVDEPSELRALMDKHGPGLPVILVFADAKATHAELMRMLAPIMSTHGTVHVFVE